MVKKSKLEDLVKQYKQQLFVQELNEKNFEEELSEIKERYQRSHEITSKNLEKLKTKIEQFVTANRTELLIGKKKSFEVSDFTLGYKINPDKIITDETTGELLVRLVGSAYVKTTYEPIKKSLVNLDAKTKKLCKIKIEKGEETFYIKRTETKREPTKSKRK